MNYNEIAKKYLQSRGLRVEGKAGQLLAPWYIMDMCYQVYTHEVKPCVLKGEAKKYVKMFAEEYHAFNQELFLHLNLDEVDALTEEMDNYSRDINNHFMVVKCAILDALKRYGEEQYLLGGLMEMHILIQIADIMWTDMYRTKSYGKGEDNMHLARMKKFASLAATAHERGLKYEGTINLNQSRALKNASSALAKKTAEWVISRCEV